MISYQDAQRLQAPFAVFKNPVLKAMTGRHLDPSTESNELMHSEEDVNVLQI